MYFSLTVFLLCLFMYNTEFLATKMCYINKLALQLVGNADALAYISSIVPHVIDNDMSIIRKEVIIHNSTTNFKEIFVLPGFSLPTVYFWHTKVSKERSKQK